jgi:hypothetical protein
LRILLEKPFCSGIERKGEATLGSDRGIKAVLEGTNEAGLFANSNTIRGFDF